LAVSPSAIFLGQTFSPLVYLTLVVVVVGIILTISKDFDFDFNVSYEVDGAR